MTWKLGYVLHDYRPSLCRRRTAHAPSERDLQTAQGSLVGTDAQQLSGLHNAVEARPQVSEGMVNEAAYRRHLGNGVVHAFEDRSYVRFEPFVSGSPGEVPKVQSLFRHRNCLLQ